MHPVIAALARHAAAQPEHPALSDGQRTLGYGATYRAMAECAAELRANGAHVVAIAADNAPVWAIADLATLAARLPCVPIPGFFSSAQRRHVLIDAGVDCLLTDQPDDYGEWLAQASIPAVRASDVSVTGTPLARFRLEPHGPVVLPPHTVKVTYTSGTTGAPKGVCLDGEALAQVAGSIAEVCQLGASDRHLSLLPLSTLLENVCGLYANLLAGATCVLPPPAAAGIRGGADLDATRVLDALHSGSATTTIMTPQILLAATDALARGGRRPPLRFLAVGGAPLHPSQLDRALALGLPVYEGYGLSECTSVVTLNRPHAARPGSVGLPLPHATVTIAADGEVLVSGATALGYCGIPGPRENPWRTGDLGHIDCDGYLHLTGRKRNIFITSFGRNVSPEWVEAELTAAPAIAQAWVWGEAKPWNAAVITPAPGYALKDVARAIARANWALPDYARVQAWIPSHHDFSIGGGYLTTNGGLRRYTLLLHYRHRLERLYKENHDHVL
jgi:long-subunit acyl-CoA synthetase (AMP-forming)